MDREKNLGLRVGDTIIHCNETFTIVNIQRNETSEGKHIVISAVDPEMADKGQQRQIIHDQVGDKIMELMKKLADKGLGGLTDI